MFRNTLFALATLLLAFSFAACKKDDPEPPVNPNETENDGNQSYIRFKLDGNQVNLTPADPTTSEINGLTINMPESILLQAVGQGLDEDYAPGKTLICALGVDYGDEPGAVSEVTYTMDSEVPNISFGFTITDNETGYTENYSNVDESQMVITFTEIEDVGGYTEGTFSVTNAEWASSDPDENTTMGHVITEGEFKVLMTL